MSDNTKEEKKPVTLSVRLIEDTNERRLWFEEKLSNGQWVEIPKTRSRCEGNSRSFLADVIEKRRQQRLMIFRKTGMEETFTI